MGQGERESKQKVRVRAPRLMSEASQQDFSTLSIDSQTFPASINQTRLGTKYEAVAARVPHENAFEMTNSRRG